MPTNTFSYKILNYQVLIYVINYFSTMNGLPSLSEMRENNYPSCIGSRTPLDTKIHASSDTLYKVVKIFPVTYKHPSVYFKSSLDYL
jgi:hypothetical protein